MNFNLRTLAKAWEIVSQMRSMPATSIHLGENSDLYRFFRKRHPRYRIIGNKVWGVALQAVPLTFADFLRGKERNCMRTNRNKAIRAGFQFKPFDPMERIDQILEINTSSSIRQNRAMHPDYLDRTALNEFFQQKRSECYGVFGPDQVLRAYCHAPVSEELCIFSRLLGHADFLEYGIMFLLLSETIREMIELRQRTGQPRWIMYDTFLGAGEGLRYFKERMGFVPYRVRWRLGMSGPESSFPIHKHTRTVEEPLSR